MKIISIAKGGLFIIECIRIIALAFILIIRANESEFSTIVIFAAPAVLFPLMALFIWLDTNRYRAFTPLFTAGKCISVFMLLGWFIITGQVTMFESLILSGDLFALALILLINNDSVKHNENKAIADTHSGG